jgi:hypothetical protein
MTTHYLIVIPAKAGISCHEPIASLPEIPAFAGTTEVAHG